MNLLNRLRGHKALRYVSLALSIVVALVAAAVVVSITIDLGPLAKPYAEKYGSKYIERPVRIGSLSIHLFSGRILVQDLRIDGLRPTDRPFFTAKQIAVALDWVPAFAFRPDFTIASVEMTDWAMLVERWENRHNFPKFTRDEERGPAGPRRFTVTMKDLRASRGQFSYEDHEAPWSIVCRNLGITMGNLPEYHGIATFNGGTVTIQDNVPMWANMKAQFVLDGPRIHLPRIDLDTDGAETVARGDVDLAHWPEQSYHVRSRVRFPRMREIFFRNESWKLSGDGDFDGTFHLFKDGRDLAGTFRSDELGVYSYRFPALHGSLHWTPKLFEVADAGARFSGGDARFEYSIKPLGSNTKPTSRFDFTAERIDLRQLTDFEQMPGLRFAGTATWHNTLEWPLGRFAEHKGDGHILVLPPPGAVPMTASLAGAEAADADHGHHEWGPFAPLPLPQHLPIAGELNYRYGPDDVTFGPSRFITERTYVGFEGTTEYGDRSRIEFHVTSRDWQESDQVLAGIMTDFGARTGPVTFGGRGEFDGLMLGPFRRPRVEGDFSGDDLRGFDTLWGAANGHVVVANSYVDVSNAVVRDGDSEIHVDGRFSLGYPREDGGEEIDARFRVVRRDIDSLRHVFQIDEYPVAGLLSGEFHLTGQYERPVGFGGMTVDDGVAYGEPFEHATATLRFDGTGVRLDGIEMAKGAGTVTGAAFVGWDSTYSFNANGRRIPVEGLAFLENPRAPLSGVSEFTATGSGTFDVPRNDIRFRVDDLYVAHEEAGQVSGTLAMRGTELSGEIDAASPRLALTGTGRIALTPRRDAEITFRFHDTSLDPYVRLFQPALSPYTTAVVSGSVRVVGELANADRLLVEGNVDRVDVKLLDYSIRNRGALRLSLDKQQLLLGTDDAPLQFEGDGTELKIAGRIDTRQRRVHVNASGDANLGVLQAFLKDVRGSGRAQLTAAVDGPLTEPVFSGRAVLTDGRIRHFSLPNALDTINGTIMFDGGGVRLDDVTATFGGGKVQFGGRIGFNGYMPGDLNVTARGEDIRLRVPEGIRSLVDADLSLTGNYKSPTLSGTVTVKDAVWNRRVDAPGSIFDLASRRGSAQPGLTPTPAEPSSTVPIRFDVQLLMPSTLRVENNLARMVASADLTLRGTYDRPVVFGHADIERGQVTFEGRRYRITRGSMDFTNPNRIEPFFDVEAETNVRVPYQTYRVTVAMTGTSDQLRPALSSDPPLPQTDVLALLFSDVRQTKTDKDLGAAPELRALQNQTQTQTQTDIIAQRATQALANPISSGVGKVVEQTFGVDTFQLTPSFVDPYNTQTRGLNPTARLTIGKRISDRVYLTFSRSLNNTANDQIVLLEIDQSDLVSWILSRNEDQQTYSLEFRVRHVF